MQLLFREALCHGCIGHLVVFPACFPGSAAEEEHEQLPEGWVLFYSLDYRNYLDRLEDLCDPAMVFIALEAVKGSAKCEVADQIKVVRVYHLTISAGICELASPLSFSTRRSTCLASIVSWSRRALSLKPLDSAFLYRAWS